MIPGDSPMCPPHGPSAKIGPSAPVTPIPTGRMPSRLAIVTPVYPNSAEPLRGIFTYHAARALQAWADVAVDCLLASYLPIGPLRPRERRYTRVDPGFRTLGVPVRYVQYPAVPVV